MPKSQQRLLIALRLKNNQVVEEEEEDDDTSGPDNLDIATAYKRPKNSLITISEDDIELTEYVKTRLLIARAFAIKKYQAKRNEIFSIG